MKNLQHISIKNFVTESKETFDELRLAYTSHGTLNDAKDNVVFIVHPFAASADPSLWWSGIVGRGRVFDPQWYYIVCVNIPGSPYGSSYPLDINQSTGKPYYYSFPKITARDVVKAFENVRRHLTIDKIQILVGISMGGQIAFQWLCSHPQVSQRAIILGANPKTTPWMAASLHVQRNALSLDDTWKKQDCDDAGREGMKLARQIGFLSYRSPKILSLSHVLNIGKNDNAEEEGFLSIETSLKNKRDNQRTILQSYINYQGDKFTQRFNAFSYDVLLTLMETHDITQKDLSLEQALNKIAADVLLVGVDSDMLFISEEIRHLKQHIQHARYREISSIYGHDALLIEYKQIEDIIVDYLDQVDEYYKNRH